MNNGLTTVPKMKRITLKNFNLVINLNMAQVIDSLSVDPNDSDKNTPFTH